VLVLLMGGTDEIYSLDDLVMLDVHTKFREDQVWHSNIIIKINTPTI
jgi:hypothetical protein